MLKNFSVKKRNEGSIKIHKNCYDINTNAFHVPKFNLIEIYDVRTIFRPGTGFGIHFTGFSIICNLLAPEVLLRATERMGIFLSAKRPKYKTYSAHQILFSK